jgi:protein TonB
MRSTFILLLGLAACGGNDPAAGGDDDPRGIEPPVLTNAEPPVRYPPELYARRAEGTVVLRLFVDQQGRVVPDSARVVERSGHDALDSAALAAVPDMRFAPARKDGAPFGTAFLQPVHFRHPQGGAGGGS